MRRFFSLGVCLTVVLAVVAAAGSAGTSAARSPSWRIAYVRVDGRGVDVLVSSARVAQSLVRSSNVVTEMAWSPDGGRVAYALEYVLWETGTTRGVFVVALAGAPKRRLTIAADSGVVWSPDGGSIAFGRACGAGSTACVAGIYVVPSHGGKARLVLRNGFANVGSWSPEGRRLVVEADGEIWIVAVDGSSRRRLSEAGDGLVGTPSWSPDGRLIAYGRRCFEPPVHGGDVFCDLAVIRPDGTGKRTIVRRDGLHGPTNFAPVWSSTSVLLVDEWGYGSNVLSVDPRTGATRKVYSTAGFPIAGPDGTFAIVTGDVLNVFDRGGQRLLRRPIPSHAGAFDVWLGSGT